MPFAGTSSPKGPDSGPDLVAVQVTIERETWQEFRAAAKRVDTSGAGLLRRKIRQTVLSARPGPYADPGHEERGQRV